MAATSSSSSSPARSAGTPATRRSRSPSSPASSNSPAKSQMTVRSLGWVWKVRPWSMPQSRPSASQHVTALAVGVVGHHVEGGEAHQVGVPRRVLHQGEVVRGPVLWDEALHRPGPEGGLVAGDGLGHQPPAERLGEPRRRRPRAGAARWGSPTGAVPPGRACRRPAARRPRRYRSRARWRSSCRRSGRAPPSRPRPGPRPPPGCPRAPRRPRASRAPAPGWRAGLVGRFGRHVTGGRCPFVRGQS